MPTRQIIVAEIGPVNFVKRRGAKNLRINIRPGGQVQVSLPKWTPYVVAERFVQQHREWIISQQRTHQSAQVKDADVIGRGAIVDFKPSQTGKFRVKVSSRLIEIYIPRQFSEAELQKRAIVAAEKALKLQAEAYLPRRLEQLSRATRLDFNDVKIKKLRSRWGSCSTRKNIALSIYLMQLPDDLIDYILIHELVHTKHHNHGRDFWQHFESLLPDLKSVRKKLHHFSPALAPNSLR